MSQQSSQSTTIDGIEFTSHMLPPFEANEILTALGKIAGPSLAELLGSATDEGSVEAANIFEAGVDGAQLAKAFGGLFTRMDAKQTEDIMRRLARVCTVSGDTIGAGKLNETMDVVFIGKLGTMYRWAGWCLGVQFGNFFESVPAAIGELVEKAKAKV